MLVNLRGDGSIDDSQEICTDSDDNVTGSLVADLIRDLADADELRGLLGSDDLFGEDGDDIIVAGGGQDFLDSGLDADLLIGGFGSNHYSDCADGSRDSLRIRSDHYLLNPLTGTAGNNADGQRTDLIEELDRRDRLVIEGVHTRRLRFRGLYSPSRAKAIQASVSTPKVFWRLSTWETTSVVASSKTSRRVRLCDGLRCT